MAFRDDVVVDWSVSPRIVKVLSPSTEITIQDLVDTCRELEQQQGNLIHYHIVSAAGKEPIGGGVLVGITATLLDAQVQFEARTTAAESGTVTTGGTTTLTDTSADFVSAGVARGSIVINFTDGSIGDVLNVVDANNLTVVELVNGTDNDFDIGDDYDVFNIEQVSVTGGNLVAVDDVGGEIRAVLSSFGTQLDRTSSSSATLQELEAIQFASYNACVTVDTTSTHTGTLFPTGTAQAPVNNFSDALQIAEDRGFIKFYVIGDATIDTGLDFTDMIFEGQGINLSTLTLESNADFLNTEFLNATIEGTLDGNSTIRDCQIADLTFVTGVINDCILAGKTILGGTVLAQFINCVSGVPGTETPEIDMGGDGPGLSVRNYNGGLKVSNKTGTDNVSIDMNSGHVNLDSTVVNGTIVVRGISKLTNNATGSAVVIDDDLIQPAYMGIPANIAEAIEKIRKVTTNKVEVSSDDSEVTVYENDGQTEAFSFSISADRRIRLPI